jgi:hypothetical protein
MIRLLALFFVFIPSQAMAVCLTISGATTDCAAANEYNVSVQKVELCSDSSCTTSVTLGDTTQTFDIASASAGAAVGNYADLTGLTSGTYTHLRSTVSSTISFTGVATTSCSAVTSTQSTQLTTSHTSAATLALSANSALNLSWATANSTYYHLVALSKALVISPTTPLPQIQIDFSTTNGHLCVGGTSYPGVPMMTVTVIDN